MCIAVIRNMLVLLIGLTFVSLHVSAEETVQYDRIRLSAEAASEVNNDVLVASLSAQRQGENPGKLANEVNQLVSRALDKCHKHRDVEVQTLGYQTDPMYAKGRQTGWRVSQSLQLKSRDPVVLGKLLGELQHDLLVTGMGYEVSAKMRNKAENGLISKAIVEFRKRAMIITRQLGHSRYRIVTMQINTAGNVVMPRQLRRFQALAAEGVAPARIEAGTQRLTVTASGVIALE